MAYMLLSSAVPFYGNDRKQVIREILANHYVFKGRRWKRTSIQARAFIRDLLVLDPEERADAESALESEWMHLHQRFASGGARRAPLSEEEELARSSMQRYAGYSKLKKMVSKNQRVGLLW